MPDAAERPPAARRSPTGLDTPVARALRALLAGLDPDATTDLDLYPELVVLILRLLFLHLAGDPALVDPTGPRLCAALTRHFDRLRAPILDPQRHPAPTTLLAKLDPHTLALALAPITELNSLGAAHEALMALHLVAQPDGSFKPQPSDRRRRAGAHYTPSSLTEPLVAASLRPLLARLGRHPTPAQLLNLRICDPAMGCGAFLLAASEHLTPLLLRAWATHGLHGLTDLPDLADLADLPDLATHARRLLAARLHGVDSDPLAVQLARLSIYLHIGDPTLPHHILEHTLRHGDSLVGLGPDHLDTLDTPDTSEPLADARIARWFAATTPAQRRAALQAPAHAPPPPPRHPPLRPLHWSLAFPEVFARPAPGFDLILGNPPFFWGNRIGRCFGEDYRDWLLQHLHPGAHGNSDLAAHFLRRAFDLLRPGGSLGFITTNSISEAETRKTGLAHILAHGGVLFNAHRDLPWPGDASVRVALLCIHRGPLPGPHHLDGLPVAEIGSDLRPAHAQPTPRPLPARAGHSFKGVDFGGVGFLLSPAARDALLRDATSPDETPYIWPVLNARRLTRHPTFTPDRSIINLGGLTLAEASARAPRCLEHLRQHVLPRRALDRRRGRRERWWHYNEPCPGLYRAIAGLPRVLVAPVVATHLLFAFVPPATIFTNALNVFAFSTSDILALLQSRIHALWAAHHGSSLRTDLRYNPTTCFETFPFPDLSRGRNAELTRVGHAYDAHRGALLRARREGLTALYHRFHDPTEHDPGVARLRDLHADLDRAVLDAYGWHDLRPTCEHLTLAGRPRLRWPQPLADEVLARLFALTAPP